MLGDGERYEMKFLTTYEARATSTNDCTSTRSLGYSSVVAVEYPARWGGDVYCGAVVVKAVLR